MPVLSAKKVTSPNELGGARKPDSGKYHVEIIHWDETQTDGDKIIVGFSVLDGTVPGMRGREWREYFNFKDSKGEDATDRILRLCLVAGLVQPGQETEEDFTQKAIGRQLIVEVEHRKYVDKKTGDEKTAFGITNFGYSTWAVDDPLVVDVPKSKAALNASGKPQQQSSGGGATTKAKSEWDDV